MNRTCLLAILLTALLVPKPHAVSAHGTAPAAAYGGMVAEDSADNWVELTLTAGRITVYVRDDAKRPVPAQQLAGKANLLNAGKQTIVELAPGDANSLTAVINPPPTGRIIVVLSLTLVQWLF